MFQPTTFGKYFLTRRLAVGGMAEVFLAKLYGADGFEKDLVIKQILPQHAKDPEFVQSFVGEAKIAVSLNHANIVGIYELGRVDGTYFIAMEYVDGLDVFLTSEAARKYGEVLTPGMALLVCEEVAKGLDYAHRKRDPTGHLLGLVHRDLNPRNVLISREGEVKILDFGIAKTASRAAEMPKTRAGVVKGTTGYMSPEQATGKDVDARTDIYQAGLLLYELLTGEALFWRPDEEITRSLMRRHEVPMPSQFSETLPPEVDEICTTCLARQPDDRPASAADLAQRLARLRFLYYPDEDHRKLGALVTRLIAKREEEVARTQIPSDIPNTVELSEVISQAIEHSISDDIETIATRFPSADLSEPGSAPLQVKSDQTVQPTPAFGTENPLETPAPEPTAVPVAPLAYGPTDSSDVEPADVAEVALVPERRWMLAAGSAAAVVVLGLALWATVGGGTTAEPEPVRPAPVSSVSGPTAVTAVLDAGAPRDAGGEVALTAAEASGSDEVTSIRRTPRTFGEATVAFGTRSCSSRVTVDGKIVTRTTPSYDHRLPAGRHRIVIEGTSCPPIERPGSLRRAIPVVVSDVMLEADRNVKIIADFEKDRLIVKSY